MINCEANNFVMKLIEPGTALESKVAWSGQRPSGSGTQHTHTFQSNKCRERERERGRERENKQSIKQPPAPSWHLFVMRPTEHQSTYSTRPQDYNSDSDFDSVRDTDSDSDLTPSVAPLAQQLSTNHSSLRNVWPKATLPAAQKGFRLLLQPLPDCRCRCRCHWQTNNFTRFIFHINDFSAVYCLLSASL